MRTGLFKWLPAAALLVAAAAAHAGTFEKTLDNGLKVIVKEDHRAPVVVQQIWYRVGSMDEITGKTGISHALEHMMFKGTRTVPPGQFSVRIAAAGGRENAFTGYDYTAYFQQLHKAHLPLAMQLESDRMENLVVSPAEFAKEIRVVMEERRWRTDDDPHSLLQEELMAAAYQEHPYHHPVIGWMDDLQHLSAADVKAWYTRWYDPSNAVLVVAGDVDPAAVFALAQKYYGVIPGHPLPPRRAYIEPKQEGIKRIVVKAPAELPYLLMAYHAPVLRDTTHDWQPYALQVLAGILNGNGAARLDKSLVREQRLASEVDVGYDTVSRGPGLFMLAGTPSQGKTAAQLEAGIRAQLARLAKDGVKPDELKRVKAQVTAAEVYKRDSVFYQAMQIGQLESVGLSYKDIPLMLQKVQEVTAQQVQQVARDIFNDDNLTVAVLDPQPLAGRRMPMVPGGGANVR
ncbi:MAG TPA: pitrilysin family protein [Gallionellaceae bacterium]|nr:pitrilysin family protein [Gallionellaceae bacterium]